jgi:hypothetical protein
MRLSFRALVIAGLALSSQASPVHAGPSGSLGNHVGRWTGLGWGEGYHAYDECPPDCRAPYNSGRPHLQHRPHAPAWQTPGPQAGLFAPAPAVTMPPAPPSWNPFVASPPPQPHGAPYHGPQRHSVPRVPPRSPQTPPASLPPPAERVAPEARSAPVKPSDIVKPSQAVPLRPALEGPMPRSVLSPSGNPPSPSPVPKSPGGGPEAPETTPPSRGARLFPSLPFGQSSAAR